MMKFTKTTGFLFLILFMMASSSWAQSIWTNPIEDSAPADFNPYIIGDVKDANITVSGIGRTGLQPNAGTGSYNAKNWPESSTIDTNAYFSFTLTPNTGYTINFTSFVFARQRSGTGPLTWAVRSSADNFTQNIGETFSPGTNSGTETISLSGAAFQNVTTPITFRIYGWGAEAAGGTGRVSSFTFNGTVAQPGTTLNAPVATAATAVTTAAFTANWDAFTGATGYRLDVSTDTNFTNILENYDNLAVAGLSQMVTAGIAPNTTYYYRVRAEMDAQTSVNSNVITVAIPECGTIAPPVASAQTFCQQGSVANLVATGTSLKWYAATTGGEPLSATTILTNGNYYVSQTVNGCESARTQVAVVITVLGAPTVTVVQPTCANATGTITITNPIGADLTNSVDGINYQATVAFANLAPGSYPVTVKNAAGCTSAITTVIIDAAPAAPAAPTATGLTFCGSATVANLTATGTDLNWYAAATGGESLAVTTPVTSGNYYVSQTVNGCESTRTEVAVVVNVTAAPTVAPLTFCQQGTVADLTATGTGLKWYAAATGSEVLAATTLLTSGNYYVSQTLNNCESIRVAVAVTVNITAVPTVAPLTFCQQATVADLTATGAGLKWYAAATGGVILTAATPLTSGNYYVSQTLNNCESDRIAVTVTITEIDAPDAEPLQDFTEGETLADLEVIGTNIVWYANEALTAQLPETTVLTDGATYYAVQEEGECVSEVTAVTVNQVLSVDAVSIKNVKYYPNPVQNTLHILSETVLSSVTIYNSLGQMVMSQNINGTEADINTSVLTAGVYMVAIVSENKTATIKVIKN